MRLNNIALNVFDPKTTENVIKRYIIQMKERFVQRWSKIHSGCKALEGHCNKTCK